MKKAESFAIYLDIGYRGIEDLLVTEISPDILRRFLTAVASRGDYPQHLGYLPEGATDGQAVALAKEVLKARKATEFAPLLIAECAPAQLPPTLAKLMLDINAHLTAKKPAGTAAAAEPGTRAGPAEDGTPDTGDPGRRDGSRRHPPRHPGCGRPPADRGRAGQRQDHDRAAQGRPDTGDAWSPSSGSCSCPSRAPPSGRSPTASPSTFPAPLRDHLEIRTFHAFFLDLVRAHGPLLTGTPAVFLPPDAETPRKADHDGDWDAETRELARRGTYVFDQLAPVTATLLERSPALRRLYSDRYPLVIVDEFQDTNLDQWRVIQALAQGSTIICLADPDQRIYEGFIPGVDEARLQQAIDVLNAEAVRPGRRQPPQRGQRHPRLRQRRPARPARVAARGGPRPPL